MVLAMLLVAAAPFAVAGCGSDVVTGPADAARDAGVYADVSLSDAATDDAGMTDAGDVGDAQRDAGAPGDSGIDTGIDAGVKDAGVKDAGSADASVPDSGVDQFRSGEIALVEDSDGSINANAMTQVFQMKAACAFYKNFDDRYDALFIYTTRNLNMVSNEPQGWPVNSPSKGIGRGENSTANLFCSVTGRLRQAVKMGSITYFTTNPDAPYKGLLFYTLSAVELMGHEFGHHWLAKVEYDLNDGEGRQCLMRAYIQQSSLPDPTSPRCSDKPEGDFNQHWSLRFNQNSVMYSNMMEDLGGGNFRVYRETLKYGPFDQYLMGLIEAKDVPPSYIVSTDYLNSTEGFPIGAGQQETITGTRINVSIDDIIRRMGPRDPVFETCHWKAAFILVYDDGKLPTPAQIAIVEAQRQRWESWYATATDGRGSFDTTLDGCGTGTTTCPGLPHPSCSK
jgi:hypothetical protein